VAALRRTAIGPFRVEDAGPALLPPDAAVRHLPEARLTREEAEDFVNGRVVARASRELVRVYEGDRFLGVGEPAEGGMKPRKVLAPVNPAAGA
jgi:hypothetical protein